MARNEGRARLVRAGFAAPTAAEADLTQLCELLGVEQDTVLAFYDETVPDPDQSLCELLRIARDSRDALRRAAADPAVIRTAVRVLGGSSGLASFLHRHPDLLPSVHDGARELADRATLQERLATAVGVTPADLVEDRGYGLAKATITGEEARRALRIAYRLELARIAAYDLGRAAPADAISQVSHALADLAGEALDAALMVARADVSAPPAGFGRFPAHEVEQVRLAVIGMGKSGAEELNYLSDVDVMFVVATTEDGELTTARGVEIGTRLASTTMRVIDDVGVEPALWEVDANLRPEGKDGALVRTLDSYVSYYGRWAKNWEFQALLKARPIAGDLDLGGELVDRLSPLVWASAGRDDFVGQVRAMRERVMEHIPADEVDIQLKLGPGGLRDIEFTVQLLQLAHGQTDESLRVRGTLDALERLADGGYIARDDASEFADDYRFLRLLEHRLQLRGLRRTHLMPRDEEGLRILARGARYENAEALLEHWRGVKRRVRGLHEKVFYRPLIDAVAALTADSFQLTSDQALERLRAIGYRDPRGALGHIQALIRGVSRRATMQRNLLPVLLDWFAQGNDPDQGLLAFRKLSEQIGDAPWYLRLLRDSAAAAKRLTTLLTNSKFAAVFIELYPEAVRWLDDDRLLVPRSLDALLEEVRGTVKRHDEPEALQRALRTFRRREVLRLAIGTMLRVNDIETTGRGLSDVATATLAGAEISVRAIDDVVYPPFAIVAMGRYGGGELGFGSDLDVMYVYDDGGVDDPAKLAKQLVARIIEFTSDPRMPIDLDADLRPEGKSGPLARSFEAYVSYYAKWSLGWEAQALLRARAVVGDPELCARFEELADTVRYPAGLSEDGLREIRRIKARVESERLPRGVDPRRHLKLGRGSLSDVEWLVQTLQLQHASEVPELRTTSTLGALRAATDAGFVDADDAEVLREAWVLASRVRSAVYLQGNRQADVLPDVSARLEGVARLLGYEPGEAQELESDYLGTTRRARRVFEHDFYGE
ncbi:bifunctional [glutamine synthetase] adenylyltransferase/[glutamine synthetase]-adenylyl-L-tyrosine phosphorylase [Pseudoclavibacter chungangensis]|uniref:Bifunctional [glutamine synthetase] adenylyltransferase/[glutamine synthetase]-adenylyl-L-tyrosine phosphorylase n=1 Tax=Pseudoclavibacter chungangensis TaxID=587635 RepID=A0A7J5BQF1_9MICO|nr:bifunctional [glutamine synthetase] adenylyltransferase/[glutamine synthetase]-adenylyl-L-tyrosine phosphorylase [Pseudoclavibacter chungangensis]KAB1655983.1 bifunctional [glutamine synthetase] adenylyltransferase/[glutamine synthetase]-adenylyl-L-tyrosine phosphorylase [Pseudoclavibacter chungangensis]NYJ66430.1 glutamate-ammonia-ligase adenylyltransferase [Pseudoclavibacter chungangensis]